MLNHWNHPLIATMNRREVLRAGALPLFGLGMDRLLGQGPAAPRTGKAKACIVLFMWGGPAQQDTWDPKPDSPDQYRGEFKTISTALPGIRIGEHLPMMAKRLDQVALIRSMTHNDVNHLTATHYLLAGRAMARQDQPLEDDFPSYGSVLAQKGYGKGPLPPSINLMPVSTDNAPRFVESSHGQGAGWLGPVWSPMRIIANPSQPNYRVGEFALNGDLDLNRVGSRKSLLGGLDAIRSQLDKNATMRAASGNSARAFDLLSNPKAAAAFDLSREPEAVRERYGRHTHGQTVLQARRLVEAGVPLVTVFWPNDGITNVSVYWDTHSRNFIDLKTRLCPPADQAFSALIDDLKDRGMYDETLVVWTGEMGRTPKVGQSVPGGAGAGRDGRDHWGKVFSSVLAGGGIKKGIVHGASDRYAAEPSTNPVRPADLAATIYHCLGLGEAPTIVDKIGREVPLTEGEILHGLLA